MPDSLAGRPADVTRPILYTAIFGAKDHFIDDHRGVDEWRKICFTDDPTLRSDTMEVVVVPCISQDPTRCARYYKLLPHVHLPAAPMSVWVDGSIRITADDFVGLVDSWLRVAPVAAVQHPRRTCVYDEARRVIELGKDDRSLVRRQISEYRSTGVPPNLGLHWTGIMCRRHDLDEVRALSEQWWDLVVRFSRRDQLSFDVARWMTGCPVQTIAHPSNDGSPPWFVRNDHAIATDFGTRPPLRRRALDRSRAAAVQLVHGIRGARARLSV